MADTGTHGSKGKTPRRARGFARAGGLIEAQMRTAAAKRGFADARLRALWPEIAGPEVAAISQPVRLTPARGPAGGLLTLAVAGAQAPKLQMMLPVVRERVNAALGPGAVGRIQLTHAAAPLPSRPPAPAAPPRPTRPAELGPLARPLSTIGDDDLRAALKTLAENVLSRRDNTP